MDFIFLNFRSAVQILAVQLAVKLTPKCSWRNVCFIASKTQYLRLKSATLLDRQAFEDL
jgi:hypothetical protein